MNRNLCGLALLGSLVLVPATARSECKEYKIVEYEDRVEAVCVGEPLTEAEKKAIQEEEKRQELENRRAKVQEDRRRKEEELAAAAEERKKKQAEIDNMKKGVRPPTSPPASDKGKINLQRL